MKTMLPILALVLALIATGCETTPKVGPDGKPPKGWIVEPQMPVPF